MLEQLRKINYSHSLIVAIIFAAVLFAVGFGYAGEQPTDPTVSINTVVSVFGPKSTEPPQITKGDVTVYSGKTRLNVTGWVPLESAEPGLQLAIVIDNSAGSLSVGSQLSDLADFISLQARGTAVGIFYAANGTVQTASPFSTDHDAVAKTLRLPLGLRSGASPSVYLSLSDLVKHRWTPTGGPREVLLISSGIDHLDQGPNSPYVDATTEDLQKAGVIVHTIYTGQRLAFGESIRGQNAQNNLVKITDGSGGEGLSEGITGPVSFSPYLTQLNNILHNQYFLTFLMPRSENKKGDLRETTVHVEVEPRVSLKYPKQVLVPGP